MRNPKRRRLPNLLLLGASGSVSRALLRRLGGRRHHFGRLLLLDKSDSMRENRLLEHRLLDYKFIHRRLEWPKDRVFYQGLLRQHRIDIVVDLTDMDTLPVLAATDAVGVSYLNTSLNAVDRGVPDLATSLYPMRERPRRAPHILCSGMNPGVVNTWVLHGARRYGTPDDVVHFEYDTSVPADGWRPMITWSRMQFLTESAWEPTGWVVDGKPVISKYPALMHREDLTPFLKPLMVMKDYPKGFVVLHEESLTVGRKLGVSSRFVYAIHPKTMAFLLTLHRQRKPRISDLELGNNTTIPLLGTDFIGVALEYPKRRVFYINSMDNGAAIGTNATCTQVAVGVYAGLFTLLQERLAPRLYFADDLYDTVYPHVAFNNLRVEHFVFAKRKRSLVLRRHITQLRIPTSRGHDQVVI